MLERGLVAVSLADKGGSALTKNRRPESSTTLVICAALAPCARNVPEIDAMKIVQRIVVPRRVHPVIAVRLIIPPRPIIRVLPGSANLLIGVVSPPHLGRSLIPL